MFQAVWREFFIADSTLYSSALYSSIVWRARLKTIEAKNPCEPFNKYLGQLKKGDLNGKMP
jgi:hypothetical protein